MEIQLFFNVSILPSIALKRWNFPDNFDFRVKILAKFLLRSQFLSICNNVTVKQQINHSAIQKVCHLHNDIFIPLTCVTLSQFYFITSLVLFIKNNKLENEKKKLFCIYGCLSAISKEVENRIFRHNFIFRHTCMYKQPRLTKYWIYNNFEQMFYSYLRYIDILLDVFFLFLAVILSEIHENPWGTEWVTEKSTWKNLCEQHHFFGCTPYFLWQFL